MLTYCLRIYAILYLFSIILIGSCSNVHAQQSELIRDFERNGLLVGQPTDLLTRLNAEEWDLLSRRDDSIQYFKFSNGHFAVDENSLLVDITLVSPNSIESDKYKHLSEVAFVTGQGLSFWQLTGEDIVRTYGQPSDREEPEVVPEGLTPGMFWYYYNCHDKALVTVIMTFEENDPDMEELFMVSVIYRDSKGARDTLDREPSQIFAWPQHSD